MAPPHRRGVQAEVLASLGLVMAVAIALLAGFFVVIQDRHLAGLQGVLGRSLLAEARAPTFAVAAPTSDVEWWLWSAHSEPQAHGAPSSALDDETRKLALAAKERGVPLMQTGPPWTPMRFAAPISPRGAVAIARVPAPVSGAVILALILADATIFSVFGAYLLRRRVVRPLRRLARAARALSDGGPGLRVEAEGIGEAVDLARAFNEMSESLERRTTALEKAVAELRSTNRSLRRARDGLDRAEKLAAVGRLAAGVAHEVGNPMGAVLAFMDMVAREPELSEQGRLCIERAQGEGERIRRILRQLLDFSRPQRGARVPLDLAACAEQSVGLVRAQSRYVAIEIELRCAPATPLARGDEGGVSQILLNLLLNAADALVGSGAERGRIVVSVSAGVLERRRGEGFTEETPRRSPDGIECRVEDDGPGVADEDRERIFDPFYTTKPPGEGTGLGLANAQRLAEDMDGTLESGASSELGGALFRLCLPLAAEPGDRPRPRDLSAGERAGDAAHDPGS